MGNVLLMVLLCYDFHPRCTDGTIGSIMPREVSTAASGSGQRMQVKSSMSTSASTTTLACKPQEAVPHLPS